MLRCLQDMGQLQQQNGELRGVAQQLQARLGEEGEVVSALRAQLVDYKLQVRCSGCRLCLESSCLRGKHGLWRSSRDVCVQTFAWVAFLEWCWPQHTQI